MKFRIPFIEKIESAKKKPYNRTIIGLLAEVPEAGIEPARAKLIGF
jgi:hypothetical protein